ncbi:MAG: hypothetical protein DCC46_04105 [Armatimonadetes bacterium]|nr:MAG: hypothetical protein DCC46_04105 [Armatimonadota bacterium]
MRRDSRLRYLAQMVRIDWKGDLAFEARPPSGKPVVLDSASLGTEPQGPSPTEMLLAAVGACTAMDVISILKKKRQIVESYRVEVENEYFDPDAWPRPMSKIIVRHYVSGEEIDPEAVARAVQLSDEKYCRVASTLRQGVEIETSWQVE